MKISKPHETGLYLIGIFFWYSMIICALSSRSDSWKHASTYILLILIPGLLTILFVEYLIPYVLSNYEKNEWKWKVIRNAKAK